MIKSIFGNNILNNTCSKILHGDSKIIKHIIVLLMLVISMFIILFEIMARKANPGNWNMNLPAGRQNSSFKPIKKLA